MNVREGYPKGCRVVATARYHTQFSHRGGRDVTAVVVGYGRARDHVRVRRDGLKSAETFHWHFWDRIV